MPFQIPVVRCKPSVHFWTLAPAGIRILAALDQLSKAEGKDILISCGNEGHPASDPHTLGEAIDVSVSGLTVPEVVRYKKRLEQTLGARFTVLYEVATVPTDPMLVAIAYVNAEATGPHLHIQRKRGTVYPPAEAVGYA